MTHSENYDFFIFKIKNNPIVAYAKTISAQSGIDQWFRIVKGVFLKPEKRLADTFFNIRAKSGNIP
jgi:hypothetical protein